VVNIYEDDEGTIYKDYDNNYPDYKIILSNGKEFTLSELTTSVIDYWRNYLLCVGIEYKKQEEKIYFGI
jgi:hypothetical protein